MRTTRRRAPASAAPRIASIKVTDDSSRNSRTPTCGFSTMSSAPASALPAPAAIRARPARADHHRQRIVAHDSAARR